MNEPLSSQTLYIGTEQHLGVVLCFPCLCNTLAVLNHDLTGTCPPPLFGRIDGSLPSLLPVSLAIARGEFSATLREEVKNIIQVSSVIWGVVYSRPSTCWCPLNVVIIALGLLCYGICFSIQRWPSYSRSHVTNLLMLIQLFHPLTAV